MLHLEALLQLLAEKYGDELHVARGCAYSLELTKDDVIRIFGKEDTVGHVAYNCKFRQTPDGDFVCTIKRWQQDPPVSG